MLLIILSGKGGFCRSGEHTHESPLVNIYVRGKKGEKSEQETYRYILFDFCSFRFLFLSKRPAHMDRMHILLYHNIARILKGTPHLYTNCPPL